MITGNITVSCRPSEDELRDEELICSSCGERCREVAIDESFDDAFGTVTQWDIGSDCCGAECKENEEDNEEDE